MSQQLRLRLDTETVPDDAETVFEDFEADRDTVESGQYRDIDERSNRVGYVEATTYLHHDADAAAAAADLADAYPDVDWLVIHARRDDREADDPEFADDPEYYDPDIDDGLRAPADIATKGPQHRIEHGELFAVIDGEEVTVEAGDIEVSPPQSDPKTGSLTIDGEGTLAVDGDGWAVAEIEDHPGKLVRVDAEPFRLSTSEFGDPLETRGDPPKYLADVDEPMPESEPSEYVDRVRISEDTKKAIRDARDDDDVQKQLDHVLDVLDVIDLE